MNNNWFLDHQWVDSPPPHSITARQQGIQGEEKPAWRAQGMHLNSKKSPKSTGWLKAMIPVEDMHIFTISLSAEGSV